MVHGCCCWLLLLLLLLLCNLWYSTLLRRNMQDSAVE